MLSTEERNLLAIIAAVGIRENPSPHIGTDFAVSLKEIKQHVRFSDERISAYAERLNELELIRKYRKIHCYYGGERELGDTQFIVTTKGLIVLWS